MVSWDYFVGFEREIPRKDLEAFLDRERYDLIEDDICPDNDSEDINYESREGGLVEIYVFTKPLKVKEGEVPDWKKSGLEIKSDIMVSTKDVSAIDEAERITKELIKRYDGVFYDTNMDEFFRKDEL